MIESSSVDNFIGILKMVCYHEAELTHFVKPLASTGALPSLRQFGMFFFVVFCVTATCALCVCTGVQFHPVIALWLLLNELSHCTSARGGGERTHSIMLNVVFPPGWPTNTFYFLSFQHPNLLSEVPVSYPEVGFGSLRLCYARF